MNDELELESQEKISFSVWKKIFKIVFRSKRRAITLALYMVLLSALDVLTPIVSSKALDVFFGENPQFEYMGLFIGIYVAIAILYMIAIYSFVRKAGEIEAEVSFEIRKEAFTHLQELSLSYYDKNAAGWIIARLTSDSRKLAEIISWGLVDMVWGLTTMLAILVVLFITSPILALIITILTPLLFAVCMYFRKKILVAYRNVRKINSKITGSLNECIQGSKTTKTLVLEDTKYKEFNETATDMRSNSIRAVIRSSILWPLVVIISNIGLALTLSAGSASILGYIGFIAIDVPTLYLFVNYTQLFFDPILQISSVLAELQQAQAAAERVIGLIETKSDIVDSPEVLEKYGTITNPKRENWEDIKGDIKFENVTFSYIEKEVVLDNFNIEIKKGTSVALVGATGSGKSTIINLLCRFYEPTSGTIYIDGVDYKKRSINWLHEKLGYVLQTPHLFTGTIKDNIRYSKLDATDEEIIQAAKAVSAHEFISKLDKGYDTEVGDGGSKLSLGQRQLISFARAVLIDPKILVLDEATSSIDTQTEVMIQEAMDKMMEGRTTFIVAHRLSTIINSDLILVIEDGKIKEQGNHKELLKLKGDYYNLYKNQFINEQMQNSAK